MVFMDDIRSLSEFQRKTKECIRRLSRTGRPEVLTVNGKAKVIVQDAEAYQRLLDELEEAKTAVAIKESSLGRGVSVKEAFARLRKQSQRGRKL